MWMAEARGRARWAPFSHLLAMTANSNRDEKKRSRPFTPDEFNPYAAKATAKPAPLPKLPFNTLRHLFCR